MRCNKTFLLSFLWPYTKTGSFIYASARRKAKVEKVGGWLETKKENRDVMKKPMNDEHERGGGESGEED